MSWYDKVIILIWSIMAGIGIIMFAVILILALYYLAVNNLTYIVYE